MQAKSIKTQFHNKTTNGHPRYQNGKNNAISNQPQQQP